MDRYPWAVELYRLGGAGMLDLGAVPPLSFRLIADPRRPRIAIAHGDGDQSWSA